MKINITPPLTDLHVDFMDEADLPAIMEIERASFTSPWSEASFREGLKSGPPVYFFVARQSGNPIGFSNFWVVEDEAHIANFAVSPACRNRGVGKYLFAQSLAYIQRLGGETVFLEVRVSNIPAQNLYRQFGFRPVSIRKRYYPDNGEDAYLFRLSKLCSIDFYINET